MRERFEYFSTFDWGGDPSSPDGFLLQRVMPHADLRFGPHFQVFFQLTSNLVWGRDPRPLDRDDLDVLQAFASLSFGSLTVRGGRQEIQYASSRLVSIREGPNVRLAFDGVRLIEHVAATGKSTASRSYRCEVRPGIFDDRAEPGQWFWGVYATGPVLADGSASTSTTWVGFARLPRSSKERHASCATRSGRASGGAGRIRLQRRARVPGGDVRRRHDRRLDGGVGRGLHLRRSSRPAAPRSASERDERRLEPAQRRPPDLQPALPSRGLLQPGQPDRSAQPRRFPSGVDA